MSSLVKPNNENNSNLIAEVTIPKGKDIDLTGTVKRVIKGLIDMDIIEDQDSVLFTKTWFNHYGYPIYSEDHNAIRKEAMDIIKDHGIKSVGRWGSWHYWNTDMVYKAINELYEAEGR
jgi:protoporphyrinogen oxidase